MGGKSDPPPAPDYTAAANATASGNLDAARAATTANRINQYTPYGSLTYSHNPTSTFDQAGYDAAMSAYNAQPTQSTGGYWGQQENGDSSQTPIWMSGTSTARVAPNRADYTKTDQDSGWSSNINLSDTGQQLLDASNQSALGLAGLQNGAMGRVANAQSTPFDTSGLIDINSQTGMDAWDKATNLIRQRQNPQLDQQQAALDAKLANQGLTAGSEGWGIQQGQFGKTRNDADIAAQMAGLQAQNQFFNQGIAGNQATLQQRSFLRNQPLNELNALRTGAQVTNPTFQNGPQQATTAGADLLGAAGNQYNAAVSANNASNAAGAGMLSGGLGLLGTAASAPAGSLAASMF